MRAGPGGIERKDTKDEKGEPGGVSPMLLALAYQPDA